jgi:polysaccharide export outer membrane protein
MERMRSRYSRSLVSLALALAHTNGCIPARVRPVAMISPGFSAIVREVPPGLEPTAAEPFSLRPGDRLRVQVHTVEPIEVQRAEVDERGDVVLPLIGTVRVAGVSFSDAAREVERRYREYDRFARVELEVSESAGHRVTVLGSVSQPGTFALVAGTRVADALGLASGIAVQTSEGESVPLGDVAAARVIRNGTALPISLALALEGSPRHNVTLTAGDLVYVPPLREQRVRVLGEVGSARALPWREGMRLSDALSMAGGATNRADRGDIRIVRGPLSAPRVFTASLSQIVSGEAPDVALAPGDIVYVTEHWLATVAQVIERLTPALAATAIGVGLARR